MANSPANTNRLYDGGINFLLGVNSNLHPSFLAPNQLSWAVNIINKGGIIDTRPGYEPKFRLPDGKVQGMTQFTPTDGQISLIMAVSGRIYVSQFPFTDYTMLSGIQFDPFVDHIVFQEATQSKNGAAIVDARSVLIMQDGVSKAAYYDGTTARHLNPGGGSNETVQGLWMAWIGNRLWVARGREVFASDIFDPLHFNETTYLGGGGSFQAMDGDIITALARTADARALIVFTIHNTTSILASITDRAQWPTTPNFVSLLFPGVGAASGKSPFFHNGELWWWSVEGARRFTAVGSSIASSRNSVSSIEMKRSFDNLSQVVQNRVCGFSFGTFLGFSIPSGDVFNRHTWVMDTSTNSQLSSESPFAWLGIWMGTRPVEWTTANVNGKDRSFYISQDTCGVRVWEAFMPKRDDNGGRIFCSVEFPGLQFGEQTSFKKFKFTSYFLSYLSGNVSITADYRGDWGCWKRLADINLCAKDCIDELICNDSNPAVYTQNRYFRTQESKHVCLSQEGTFSEDIGTYFQNRIRWYGKNAVRIYKSQADQWQESSTGECAKSDTACRELECCDPEINYISHVNDCSYGSGSSEANCCSI
jgi:hypothetical protein